MFSFSNGFISSLSNVMEVVLCGFASMLVELDRVVVVVVIEGSVVVLNCLMVDLEGVVGLVEVVELRFELDILVVVAIVVVIDIVVFVELVVVVDIVFLVEVIVSAPSTLVVLLDVGICVLVDDIIGGKFSSLVVFCNILAEFSVVSISSTVITFSISTFFSGRFFTVILGPKFHNGLSVSGW